MMAVLGRGPARVPGLGRRAEVPIQTRATRTLVRQISFLTV